MTEKYTKSYAYVKHWRKRTDERIYYVMGNRCGICGYDKCVEALDFHHIDPSQKEFTFGELRRHTIAWEIVENELRKCVLLCANCHREYHAGLIDIELTSSFSEERMLELKKPCLFCGEPNERFTNDYCGRSCRSKANARNKNISEQMRNAKSIWINVDVVNLLARNNGIMTQAAKEIGLSDNGVKRRFKKITGFDNWKEHINSLPVIAK